MKSNYIITSTDNCGELDIITYDALRHVSTSPERSAWILDEHPFFDRDTFMFWRVYTNEGAVLSDSGDMEERRLFLKRPYYIAKADNNVLGGIWIEDVRNARPEQRSGPSRLVDFHVSVHPKYMGMGVASKLLNRMESDMEGFDGFYSGWESSREYGQSAFFTKHGYEIKTGSDVDTINSAIKLIR